MKAAQVLALLGFTSVTLAQSLPPSPTASVGCEPHGDHWHCEGPAEGGEAEESVDPGPSPTASIGCEPHGDHWHCEGPAPTEGPSDDEESEEEEESVDPGPSPTASIGCEPHGDHWHCEGPAPTDGPAEDEHDDDEEEGVDPGPSPTASVGCEPHGDHWHCEGPAEAEETASISESLLPTPTDDETSEPTESLVDDVNMAGSVPISGAGAVLAAAAGIGAVLAF